MAFTPSVLLGGFSMLYIVYYVKSIEFIYAWDFYSQ